ncbi:Uncharacterised protein [uncultured archaeon]|nr:Uncharacterised protein [uncultured archaeon]
MKCATQTCRNCGVEKRLTDFKKDMRGKLGRRRVCKKCLEKSTDIDEQTRIYVLNLGEMFYREYLEIIKERVRERSKRTKERRKNYKWKCLNKPFAGSEAHHISKDYVIHLPKALHNYCGHSLDEGREMVEANTLAFEYLFSNPEQISISIEFAKKLKETLLP